MTARHRAFANGDFVDWVPAFTDTPADTGVVVDVARPMITIRNFRGALVTHHELFLRPSAFIPHSVPPAVDPFWVTV